MVQFGGSTCRFVNQIIATSKMSVMGISDTGLWDPPLLHQRALGKRKVLQRVDDKSSSDSNLKLLKLLTSHRSHQKMTLRIQKVQIWIRFWQLESWLTRSSIRVSPLSNNFLKKDIFHRQNLQSIFLSVSQPPQSHVGGSCIKSHKSYLYFWFNIFARSSRRAQRCNN